MWEAPSASATGVGAGYAAKGFAPRLVARAEHAQPSGENGADDETSSVT